MNSLTSDYLMKIKQIEAFCSECKARNTIFTDEVHGTRVCKACGTIHEMNIIDEASEWRNFGSESSGGADMNRVGGPVNSSLDSGGISATITGTTDTKLINSNNRISSNAKDKNKIKGWAIIKEICRDIHITKQVEQDAKDLFSLVEDNEKLKGKKLYSKVASVIMIASRKSQLPKNMKDILKGANVTKRELSRCYNLIRRKV
jgi:transcription initiation factor TFIIB